MHYRFGDFVLDRQRDELRRAGAAVRLDRQVFAVLAYLGKHHERVVSRQKLFEQLCPERLRKTASPRPERETAAQAQVVQLAW